MIVVVAVVAQNDDAGLNAERQVGVPVVLIQWFIEVIQPNNFKYIIT